MLDQQLLVAQQTMSRLQEALYSIRENPDPVQIARKAEQLGRAARKLERLHQEKKAELLTKFNAALNEKSWTVAAKLSAEMTLVALQPTIDELNERLKVAIEEELKISVAYALTQGRGNMLFLIVKHLKITGYKEATIRVFNKNDVLVEGNPHVGLIVQEEMLPYRLDLFVESNWVLPCVATHVCLDESHVRQHYEDMAQKAFSAAQMSVEGQRLYVRKVDNVENYTFTLELRDKNGRKVLGQRPGSGSYAFFNLSMDAHPYMLNVSMKRPGFPSVTLETEVKYPHLPERSDEALSM